MKLKLKYFGMIAEATGMNEETIDVSDDFTASELKYHLIKQYDLTDPASIQIAVNKSLETDIRLNEGDEVAILPPFAGG
ncbi:MoaD/ThiS family protein [Marinigracilibium pacificum]|uniref:Molybdopterin synthase sulfur carrier subunit n=1 Tax=Marinigracilibium pacificum TaxID=2729599 RepID=A0A848IYA1_9BACT|nr:MoaD/ThiS family protein [Marinigracilibium pacificum]NMM48301.1 MoaD/ThiS family protein [Marinigracilibium pacificum]